jgi:DeoR family fructose operon transcriptional repressor
MFVQDRHSAILTHMAKRPRWTVTGLQKALRVSRSTLRRDLNDLQDRGEVLRVHGGVVHVGALKGEPSLDKRARQAIDAKRCIAAAASDAVPTGATVFVDAGTTCLEVGRRLILRGDVRIITHSIRLLMDADGSKTPITCIGGDYRAISQAVVGGLAMEWMKHLRCDIAIMGASGLNVDGASTTEISETAIKQAAMNIAGESILVAHAEKWDAPATVRFAEWKQFNRWITDASLPPAVRKSVAARGVDVIIAKAESE